jgi:hypothetical protein
MLDELGYEQLMKLCDDEDVGVQEQALSIIRNVMTGEVQSIGLLFENLGSARLMNVIVDKLGNDYSEIVAAVLSVAIASNGRPLISASILGLERRCIGTL